jgi:hypothetical protein
LPSRDVWPWQQQPLKPEKRCWNWNNE